MRDNSHLTIILCSSVRKIVIRQKQKVNRNNNNNNNSGQTYGQMKFNLIIRQNGFLI
jgi:hypothetical protein